MWDAKAMQCGAQRSDRAALQVLPEPQMGQATPDLRWGHSRMVFAYGHDLRLARGHLQADHCQTHDCRTCCKASGWQWLETPLPGLCTLLCYGSLTMMTRQTADESRMDIKVLSTLCQETPGLPSYGLHTQQMSQSRSGPGEP